MKHLMFELRYQFQDLLGDVLGKAGERMVFRSRAETTGFFDSGSLHDLSTAAKLHLSANLSNLCGRE